MTTTYLALIADAAASRGLDARRRDTLQQHLRALVAEWNRTPRYRSERAARFAPTLGDEPQGLLRSPPPGRGARHATRARGAIRPHPGRRAPGPAAQPAAGLGARARAPRPRSRSGVDRGVRTWCPRHASRAATDRTGARRPLLSCRAGGHRHGEARTPPAGVRRRRSGTGRAPRPAPPAPGPARPCLRPAGPPTAPARRDRRLLAFGGFEAEPARRLSGLA